MSSSTGTGALTGVNKAQKRANYKLKYKLLKRCIKEIVLENAALCDQASDIQHQILVAQEERKFLWKKYTSTQGNSFTPEDLHTTGTNTGVINPSSTEAQQPTSGSQKKPPRKSSTPRSGSAATGTANGGNTPRSRQTPSSRKRSNKKVAQDTNNATTGIVKDATPPIPS